MSGPSSSFSSPTRDGKSSDCFALPTTTRRTESEGGMPSDEVVIDPSLHRSGNGRAGSDAAPVRDKR